MHPILSIDFRGIFPKWLVFRSRIEYILAYHYCLFFLKNLHLVESAQVYFCCWECVRVYIIEHGLSHLAGMLGAFLSKLYGKVIQIRPYCGKYSLEKFGHAPLKPRLLRPFDPLGEVAAFDRRHPISVQSMNEC